MPRPPTVGLRWTTPDQWHVTLRFLGSCDEEAAKAAFRSIAGVTSVAASVGPVVERFGRRILHLPVHGLEPLAAATVAATRRVGRPPDRRPFSGHITLARASDRRGVDLRPLVGVPLAGSWPVSELTLVCSHLGQGHGRAARYEVVDRLPLPSKFPPEGA